MQMTVNLHTHTFRCNHATKQDRDYVERALAAGIKTLGFSDHTPMPFRGEYYSNFRMRPELLPDYVASVLALREEYRGRIDILLGFEVEYYPALFRDLLKMLCEYPTDYLLLGQHFLGNEQGSPYSGSPTEDEAVLARYVDQTMEALDTGMFTYFAHPDLVNYTGPEKIYRRHITRLCRRAKELDVPLEINLLGLWGGRSYPCDRFFRIAAEVGNRVVYGTDAHQPERFDDAETPRMADAMCERCGITPTQDIVLRKPHIL